MADEKVKDKPKRYVNSLLLSRRGSERFYEQFVLMVATLEASRDAKK